MSKRSWAQWSHILWLAHHLYAGITYQFLVDVSKINDERIMLIRNYGVFYLTTWNFAAQMVFLILAIIADTMPNNSKLKIFKGYLFHSLVVPGTILVCMMFWIFFSINREWVYPEICDTVYPYWLNYASHGTIIGVVITEYLLSYNKSPSFKIASIILGIVSILYDIAYFGLYFTTGKWLYGFFYEISFTSKLILLATFHIVTYITLKANLQLHRYIYKNRRKKQ